MADLCAGVPQISWCGVNDRLASLRWMGRGQAVCPKLLFFLERFLVFVRDPGLSAHARLHRNQFPERACWRGQIQGLVVRSLIHYKQNHVFLIAGRDV